MSQRRFPWFLALALFIIAGVDCVANYYSWYWVIRWFDMPMHFAGGAWVAGVVLWWKFFSGKQDSSQMAPTLAQLVVWGVLGAFIIGLGWEVYEAVVSLVAQGHINNMQDTISDLFLDMAGGTLTAVIYNLKKHYA